MGFYTSEALALLESQKRFADAIAAVTPKVETASTPVKSILVTPQVGANPFADTDPYRKAVKALRASSERARLSKLSDAELMESF